MRRGRAVTAYQLNLDASSLQEVMKALEVTAENPPDEEQAITRVLGLIKLGGALTWDQMFDLGSWLVRYRRAMGDTAELTFAIDQIKALIK